MNGYAKSLVSISESTSLNTFLLVSNYFLVSEFRVHESILASRFFRTILVSLLSGGELGYSLASLFVH